MIIYSFHVSRSKVLAWFDCRFKLNPLTFSPSPINSIIIKLGTLIPRLSLCGMTWTDDDEKIIKNRENTEMSGFRFNDIQTEIYVSRPGSKSALYQWAKQSQNKQSRVVCVHSCTLTQFSHAKQWDDLLFLLMSWMEFDVMN